MFNGAGKIMNLDALAQLGSAILLAGVVIAIWTALATIVLALLGWLLTKFPPR